MRNLYKRLGLTLGLILLMASVVFAQERTVSGTVTDETGSTMPGVNVLIKGTALGTATDADGKFAISIPNDNATLVFSFVGYANAEVVVGSRSTINIQLTADVTTLTELVVTGYTTERKADIIGSVSVVNSKDLLQTPAANLTTQLQGRAAGVVVSASGEPGAAARVRIRGFASFGNNDPLYVVDGVPTEDPSRINPNDIESIQILKDATSASIYGSRAANGVIIVTTKRGKAGTSNITYDMYYGSQSIPNSAFPDMLDTQEYMTYLNKKGGTNHPVFGAIASPVRPDFIVFGGSSGFRGGVPASSPEADPSLYQIKKGDDFHQIMKTSDGTDWFREATRTAPIQSHQISASGGSEKGSYNIGLNYFNQDGVFNYTNYKRYVVRANTQFAPQQWLRIGENMQVGYEDRLGNDNKGEGGAWAQSYRMVPYIPVYDIFGGFGGNGVGDSGNGSNPVANLYRQRDNKNNSFSIFGNVFGEVDIIKGLTFRTSYGLDYNNRFERNIVYQTYERSENVNTTQLGQQVTSNTTWTWTNTLTYDKTFGSHNIKLLAGYEAVKSVGRGQVTNVESFDIEQEDLISLNTAHTILNSRDANLYINTLASMFGRVDYLFKDKYIFNATIRRDGSSKFGADNRYAVFPAFGLGWRISEESFMQNIAFINDLKLRGGWGQMGSQKNVQSANSYSTFVTDPSTTNYDITGSNGSLAVGFAQNRRGSTATKWETTTTTNIGLDGSMFDGKLDFSLNWFKNDTEDLLVRRQPTGLEPVVTQPRLNIGSITNKGFDISLTNRGNITSEIGYNATLTITSYKNEVTRIDGENNSFYRSLDRLSNALVSRKGEALSSFEGFEIDGFWTQAQLDDPNRLQMDGATLGSWRYKDQNGDGVINDEDRVIIGSPHPKMQLGLNLGLTYKGFDLNAFFFWNYGNKIYNYTKYYTDIGVFVGGVSDRVLYDAWTPENPNSGSLPNLSGGYTSFTTTTSNDYYIENGSYLRLRNLQLGYTVPVAIAQKVRLQKARLYVQGQNLFTVTDYSGPDPDLNIQSGDPNGEDRDLYMGVDRSGFPNTRQWLVGLSLTF